MLLLSFEKGLLPLGLNRQRTEATVQHALTRCSKVKFQWQVEALTSGSNDCFELGVGAFGSCTPLQKDVLAWDLE